MHLLPENYRARCSGFSPEIHEYNLRQAERRKAETKLFMKEMEIREEDEIMACELFDQYRRQGREEGEKEGRKKGELHMIRNFMQELHLTVEEALKAARIPQEDWEQYQKQLM